MSEEKTVKPMFGKLFISGILDGLNIFGFIKHIYSDFILILLLLVHISLQILVLLPIQQFIEIHFNPENVLKRENQLAIFHAFPKIEPKYIFTLFFYTPWMLISYYLSGIFCDKIAQHMRNRNPLLRDQIPYKQILEQNPKTYLEGFNYLVRVAVNWGISQIPKYSIILENKAVGFIPYVGIALSLVLGSLYSSYLIFTHHWDLLPETSVKESGVFPEGFTVFDQYCFVEVNWEYYLGFQLPMQLFIHFFLPSNYFRLSIEQALYALTIPLSFAVVEREEIKSLSKKKDDVPVCTTDGQAHFLLYNGFLPRIVTKYLIQWADKGDEFVVEKSSADSKTIEQDTKSVSKIVSQR